MDKVIRSFLSDRKKKFYRLLLSLAPYLDAANRMVIVRMGFDDHGLVHSKIVTRNALQILDIVKGSIPLNIIQEKVGTFEDAQLVVMMGAF